jgi:hypothetical protein
VDRIDGGRSYSGLSSCACPMSTVQAMLLGAMIAYTPSLLVAVWIFWKDIR